MTFLNSGYVLAALRLARIRLRGYAYLRILRKYGSALALLLRNTRNDELRLCARRSAACAHTPTRLRLFAHLAQIRLRSCAIAAQYAQR